MSTSAPHPQTESKPLATQAAPGSEARAADSAEVLERFHAQLDLVDLVARQMARRIAAVVTLDDLRSFGREGLLQAARNFDASRGVPFRRWANLRIKGAMIDGVRQWGELPRRVYRELRAMEAGDQVLEVYDAEDAADPATTPESADARLTTLLSGISTAMAMGALGGGSAVGGGQGPAEDDGGDAAHGMTPEEIVAASEVAARVRAVVARLDDRERRLIERHYFADDTLDAAAASMGLSKSWGSRLHARAIESLARALRKLDR